MKIRMLTGAAGNGWSCGPGEVVDLPDDLAAELVRSGHAEHVREQPVECAVKRRKRDEKAAK